MNKLFQIFQINRYLIFLVIMIVTILFSSLSIAGNKTNTLIMLEKKYSSVNYLNAKFTQNKTVKFISKPLISVGELWVAKNYGFIWQIKTPFENKILVNSNGVYKIENNNKKEVDDIQMEVIADFFMKIFSSDFNEIKKDFTITDKQINKTWELSLKPTAFIIKKSITEIVISGEDNLEKVVITDINNNTSEIIFSDLAAHKTITTDEQSLFK